MAENDPDRPKEFQHDPLENPAKQIRLLRFQPCDHTDDPLELELSTWPTSNPPKYTAISYTWGPIEMQTVHVNGQTLEVRTNCHYTLSQVRARYPESYIWLDSICINQRDNGEKTYQVAMMKDIYVGASLVLVCVGKHEDGSETVVEVARAMEREVRKAAREREEEGGVDEMDRVVIGPLYRKEWSRCVEALQKDEALELREALIAFMERPYWNRLWITQEVAAAQRVLQVLVGSDTISWLGMYLLLELTEIGNASSAPSALWEDVEQWSRYRPYAIAPLWYDIRLSFLEVESALQLSSERLCYDPRDRIYGLLGLIDWSSTNTPIMPDYDKTPLQLAVDITERVQELVFVSRTLVALDVLHKDLDMQSLRKSALSGTRECSTHKHLKWSNFSGVALLARSVENQGSEIVLVGSEEQLSEHRVPEAIRKMIKNHHDKQPETDPKPLATGNEIVGFLTHKAEPGDILAYPNSFNDGDRILLVLRPTHSGQFDVVGQGFLIGEFTWKSLAGIENPTKKGWRDEHDFISIFVDMTAEDAVLFVGQDLVRDEEGEESYNPEARVERLFVNPVAQPKGAGRIRASKETSS
ncbi:hypothetical protein PRZ48_005227 [Zasmidium cellare]|uniref:Heterokaryon incompatibility domain-containing protein n=1 Tax=Zasmidium cellare TaxID=395010 RepID=A0ABR0ESY5_ZASCE|nr:hypothetical protein PRZ48_005227 [Zasmidium cellare]